MHIKWQPNPTPRDRSDKQCKNKNKKRDKAKGEAATIMCLMHKSKTHLKLNRSIQQITKQSSAARRERRKKQQTEYCDMKAIIFHKGLCVCVCECVVSVCLYVVFEYELFSLHAYKTFKSQPTGNNNDEGKEE